MLTKFLSLIAVTALVAACSTAPPTPQSDAEKPPFEVVITQEGQFELLGKAIDAKAPSTATGKVGRNDGLSLKSSETTFKASQGVSFGFSYQVKGISEGLQPGFEMRALHPAMTGPSGKPMTSSTAETVVVGDEGNAQNGVVYTLTEAYEVLPGRWSLQLLYKGRVVLSKDFVLQ